MSAVSPDVVLGQLQWRYATKRFDPTKKIAPELWQKLEDAVALSPSSFGLQPWKLIVVTDPTVRAKLKEAAWNQPQISDASHLVVFAVKTGMGVADAERLVKRTAEVRGLPVESLEGMKNMIGGPFTRLTVPQIDDWMSRQVYIALGVFLTSAAMIGVDACPMEGFETDKFDAILGLSAQGYASRVLATAGYRSSDDKYATTPKVRYAANEVFEHV